MSVGDVVSGSSLSSCAGRLGGRARAGAAWVGDTAAPCPRPWEPAPSGTGPGIAPGHRTGGRSKGDPGTGRPTEPGRRELGRKPRFPEGAFSGSHAPGLYQNPRAHGPGAAARPRAALSHTLLSPHVPSQPLTHAPWHGRVPRRALAPAPFPPCSHARTHARPGRSHAPAPARLRAPFPRPRLSPTAGAAGCRRPPQQERAWGGVLRPCRTQLIPEHAATEERHRGGRGAMGPILPPAAPRQRPPGISLALLPAPRGQRRDSAPLGTAPGSGTAPPGRKSPHREPARRGPTAAVLWGARGSTIGHCSRLCWELPHGHVGSVPAPQPLVSCFLLR